MTEHERDDAGAAKRKAMQGGDAAEKKLKAGDTDGEDSGTGADVASHRPAGSDGVDSSDASGDGAGTDEEPKLSKRQMKKEKKKELYRANLAVRRAREKERQRQRKREARLNNVALGPSRKELKRCTMAGSDCRVRIAIDMSFDHLMSEKDLGKCIKQILRCYSANRRAKNPLQLHITSFDGKTKDAMAKHSGYNNWDVYFQPDSYLDLFDREDIVYLTSESENVLHELQDDKVYVIGGLVDHNSQKGLTLEIAEENGIQHAQLPIASFLEMKTRKVLSIVHVFEIVLLVSEGMSWKEALLHVMPARKGAAEKSTAPAPGREACGVADGSPGDADRAPVDAGGPPDTVPAASLPPGVTAQPDA
ncbi:tRNA methyltransferase 10 homolog A [Bacillus rossius redtenbacheri]|uniref:tRNA methyltransferase 10 homolog A n=1 Tax=Bacillus rossius redtenbacheri TaxID=93214 RepID=UPI002FDDB9C9